MAHRYFTEDISGSDARITGPDAAHLARVLRVQPGARLLLCDGNGTDYDAEVVTAAPEEITLRVMAHRPTAAEPTLRADMFIGYAKGDRLEWAIQKAVELGATSIMPFFSEYTVVRPKNEEQKNQRYTRIAHEAAKQSGRGILPQVSLPLDFAAMLSQATLNDTSLFFFEEGGVSLREALRGSEKSASIITGAEGGFSPAEVQAARAAGCRVVGLGPRILRCETAPVAALAAVMALSGNLE